MRKILNNIYIFILLVYRPFVTSAYNLSTITNENLRSYLNAIIFGIKPDKKTLKTEPNTALEKKYETVLKNTEDKNTEDKIIKMIQTILEVERDAALESKKIILEARNAALKNKKIILEARNAALENNQHTVIIYSIAEAYDKALEAYDKALEAYDKALEAYDKALEAYQKKIPLERTKDSVIEELMDDEDKINEKYYQKLEKDIITKDNLDALLKIILEDIGKNDYVEKINELKFLEDIVKNNYVEKINKLKSNTKEEIRNFHFYSFFTFNEKEKTGNLFKLINEYMDDTSKRNDEHLKNIIKSIMSIKPASWNEKLKNLQKSLTEDFQYVLTEKFRSRRPKPLQEQIKIIKNAFNFDLIDFNDDYINKFMRKINLYNEMYRALTDKEMNFFSAYPGGVFARGNLPFMNLLESGRSFQI